MSGSRRAEDPRLLSLASAISTGGPVNWEQVSPDSDAETTAIVEQLRVLDGVLRLSHPIPDVWGPFTITGEIGRGAYGTVYRAFDDNLNLEVALKVIRVAGPHVDISRGLNEARLLAQVNHPNVVRVYRAERIGDEVGVSMELVHGRTLNDLVALQGPFSARETILIGTDICRALAAVHSVRLVHGDIKAQNVMRAKGGRTVLMDFGAGFDVKTDQMSHHQFAGTPLYLAPEVFAGGVRTPVSDIYSVGVLLYYLATGAYPTEGRTRAELGRWHQVHTPPRLLRDLRPDLPEPFIRVVDQALAERPEDRYQTAGKLEAALNQALRNEDAAPGRRSPYRPWGKSVLAAAVVIVALAVGYGLWNTLPDRIAMPRSGAAPPDNAAPSAAPTADTYRIEAGFYREQNGTTVRLQPGARVAPGDRIFLQVVSSVPTYLYVVNEDDQGQSFLLFPLAGRPQANPLSAATRHVIPDTVNGERMFWTVSSAGGREHFLIFASPLPPSPAFARLFAALPQPSLDTAVLAQPLSTDQASALRGVGALSKAPAQAPGTKLNEEFSAPLPDIEETARGVWVRQLTLANPK